MSILPCQTNITANDYFFVKVDASTISGNSGIYDRLFTNSLSTGRITAGSISSLGNLQVGGNATIGSNLIVKYDISGLNITATDTLTSYFNNTQYLTSDQGANIHSLLITSNIGGTGTLYYPISILSSISTTSITLDGNTLDTAGQGIGAELLLNGVPIATASTLASSILTWSYYPALSNVDFNNFGILGGGVIQADTGNFYDVNADRKSVV